jgi:hypothetical protein
MLQKNENLDFNGVNNSHFNIKHKNFQSIKFLNDKFYFIEKNLFLS